MHTRAHARVPRHAAGIPVQQLLCPSLPGVGVVEEADSGVNIAFAAKPMYSIAHAAEKTTKSAHNSIVCPAGNSD